MRVKHKAPNWGLCWGIFCAPIRLLISVEVILDRVGIYPRFLIKKIQDKKIQVNQLKYLHTVFVIYRKIK